MDLTSAIVSDFAIIMAIAAAVTFLFYKIKQPLILGYLIAGVIIGPYTPPFSLVSGLEVLEAAANLGVILLLFGIGLEFPLSKLRAVGRVSAGVAAIEITFMLLVSYIAGWGLGWPLMDSLFLGTALASSSTVIIAKVLTDMGKLKDTSSLIMLGVLVLEDLVVVALLAIVTPIAIGGEVDFDNLELALVKTVAFVAGILVVGGFLVPRIVDWCSQTGHNEVLILSALGLCFGSSIVANLLGFSMAIGAFLIGVVMAGAKCAEKVATLTSPLKDMFGAMFFVSVGALIDITQFRTFIIPALVVTVLMVIIKMLGCGLGTRLFGYDAATSLKVGLGMSQIGEFAFIVMAVGLQLGVISPSLFPIVGVAAAITTFATPYLITLGYRLAPFVESGPRLRSVLRIRR